MYIDPKYVLSGWECYCVALLLCPGRRKWKFLEVQLLDGWRVSLWNFIYWCSLTLVSAVCSLCLPLLPTLGNFLLGFSFLTHLIDHYCRELSRIVLVHYLEVKVRPCSIFSSFFCALSVIWTLIAKIWVVGQCSRWIYYYPTYHGISLGLSLLCIGTYYLLYLISHFLSFSTCW